MALSIKGASVFTSYLISIIGVAWSNADKSKAFPAKIMTEWLLILLSCTLFSPRLNREALAAWSVTVSSCASVNCRGIWWCPSLHPADGVSARRGHALFWELWSITKCFLPCAVFGKTILIAQKKQAVLKSCVVCCFFFNIFLQHAGAWICSKGPRENLLSSLSLQVAQKFWSCLKTTTPASPIKL